MKVTPKKYTLKSINYKFTIFIETIKKYRKTLNSVMCITLKGHYQSIAINLMCVTQK